MNLTNILIYLFSVLFAYTYILSDYTLSRERSCLGLTKIGLSVRHHAIPCYRETGFDRRVTKGCVEPACSLVVQSIVSN